MVSNVPREVLPFVVCKRDRRYDLLAHGSSGDASICYWRVVLGEIAFACSTTCKRASDATTIGLCNVDAAKFGSLPARCSLAFSMGQNSAFGSAFFFHLHD
mgnify:CR=1 FL=1